MIARLARRLGAAEGALVVALLTAMSLLPVLELLSRQFGLPSIPGSSVFVQHLTLWVAFVGSTLAARSDRLLALSANTLLPARWVPRVRVFTSVVTAAVSLALAWASLQFVLAEREGGTILALGIGKWVAQAIMPVGFLVIAVRATWHASPRMTLRILAAAGLLVPALLELVGSSAGGGLVTPLICVVPAAAFLGLPIFATLGGIALLLFWKEGVPIAAVPVETYRQVASPVLPSIPLFTFAGYLLAEGGASQRLLRVYAVSHGGHHARGAAPGGRHSGRRHPHPRRH